MRSCGEGWSSYSGRRKHSFDWGPFPTSVYLVFHFANVQNLSAWTDKKSPQACGNSLFPSNSIFLQQLALVSSYGSCKPHNQVTPPRDETSSSC